MQFTATWTKVEGNVLSEVSQREEDKYGCSRASVGEMKWNKEAGAVKDNKPRVLGYRTEITKRGGRERWIRGDTGTSVEDPGYSGDRDSVIVHQDHKCQHYCKHVTLIVTTMQKDKNVLASTEQTSVSMLF